jgi:hypothetical protein
MYNNVITAAGATTGVAATATGGNALAHKLGIPDPASAVVRGSLAFTGLNVAYLVCAGFALLAVGFALLRIAPRFGRR